MGAFPAERLQKKFGRSRVEPVTFTSALKEDLATGLYSAFTEQTIRIPQRDKLLLTDLCSIRRLVTSAGNVRYDAPQTDDGHGDRAWALSLALHACSGPDRRRHEV
jgi:phage FluMu gp28-like protein